MKLASRPADAELRLKAAEALDARDKPDEVVAILDGFVNLTGHDDEAGLPCLCKTCFPAAPLAVEAGGFSWTRSFAVAGTRVLYFYQLSDQHRPAVRESVAQSMRLRLRSLK